MDRVAASVATLFLYVSGGNNEVFGYRKELEKWLRKYVFVSAIMLQVAKILRIVHIYRKVDI